MDTSWGKKSIEISFVKGDNLSTLRRQLVVTAGHAEVYIINDFGNVEVKSVESIVSKLGSPKNFLWLPRFHIVLMVLVLTKTKVVDLIYL